jgi:hypothetical protein
MNIFELLEADHQRIDQQLGEFITCYDQVSNAERFERASLVFDEIRKHFERQESLFPSTFNETEADQALMKECLKDRKDINDALDNLLMSHVDDSDFTAGLRALLEGFHAHLRHYADKLFVEFRQQLSPQVLRTMNSQATDWMLRPGKRASWLPRFGSRIIAPMKREDSGMDSKKTKRHPSLQPLSRDHGIGLVCAQHGHKAVRASERDRVRLAEQIRAASRDVILSYLEDEQRVLSPVISNGALRAQFQQHHNNVRTLINELDQLESAVDPGLGLMASVASSLDAYIRWEENSLFPALEQTLNGEELSKLCGLTASIEAGRSRPTQLLHGSITLEKPTGLPDASTGRN